MNDGHDEPIEEQPQPVIELKPSVLSSLVEPLKIEPLKTEKEKDLLSANWEKEKAIETLAMEQLALG